MNNLSSKWLRIQFKTTYVSIIFPETDQKMASKNGSMKDISIRIEVWTFAEKKACIMHIQWNRDFKVTHEL
jgi:hypothetical protein